MWLWLLVIVVAAFWLTIWRGERYSTELLDAESSQM